ncbi:hypothetical protein Tco_0253278, partial [Tanacetum coccineum]
CVMRGVGGGGRVVADKRGGSIWIYQKSNENRQKRANTDTGNGRAQKKPRTQSQSQEKSTLGQFSVNKSQNQKDKNSKVTKQSFKFPKVT